MQLIRGIRDIRGQFQCQVSTTDISDDTDLVRADGAARLAQVRRSVGGHHSLCLNENLLWKTKLSTFAEEKFAEKHSRKLCGEY